MKRFVALALIVAALLAVGIFDVPARYILAPLLGLLILRIGLASFGSLRTGAAHVPSGPPQPLDPSLERITYWCAGCGAEVLLLVRGAEVPPRHCGERMAERREVPRAAFN